MLWVFFNICPGVYSEVELARVSVHHLDNVTLSLCTIRVYDNCVNLQSV